MKEPNYRPRPRWIVEGDNKVKSSQRHEKRVAKMMKDVDPHSRVTPGSGSKHIKGDVQGRFSFVECKETKGQSVRLSVDWLGKVETHARGEGKLPLLHISFLSPGSPFRRKGGEELLSKDWVVMPEWLFKRLMEQGHD